MGFAALSQCELASDAALLTLLPPQVLVGGFVLCDIAAKYSAANVFILFMINTDVGIKMF